MSLLMSVNYSIQIKVTHMTPTPSFTKLFHNRKKGSTMAPEWQRMYSILLCFSRPLLLFPGTSGKLLFRLRCASQTKDFVP